MQVGKWGDSLAVHLPAEVIEQLDLKEGDVHIAVTGPNELTVARGADREKAMARLRAFRGVVPADFKFDREEAHVR